MAAHDGPRGGGDQRRERGLDGRSLGEHRVVHDIEPAILGDRAHGLHAPDVGARPDLRDLPVRERPQQLARLPMPGRGQRAFVVLAIPPRPAPRLRVSHEVDATVATDLGAHGPSSDRTRSRSCS